MSKIITDEKQIDKLLSRGVENIYPSKEEFKKVLLSGKKLSIYSGVDPTAPTLHIGHGVVFLKLRELQDLGHEVILLLGDFTGRIGDPTDKDSTRKQLTKKEVKNNLKSYTKQASKILDMKKIKVKFNSKWLAKLTLADIVEITSEFTLQQMIERDMFEKRMAAGHPIYLHEFLYPLMQGYDSVAMNVDVEIGGNDQTFNMLMGRTMMKTRGKEKYVLTTKLLTDPTGKKMGKSEGNMVTLNDKPSEMFNKIMSWPDTLVPLAFEICTKTTTPNNTSDPKASKLKLAFEITKLYHGEEKATASQDNWEKTFSKKEIPEDVEEVSFKKGDLLADTLVTSKIVSSKSDFRRLIDGGAISKLETEEKIFEVHANTEGGTYRVGKKRFVKFVEK